MKVKVFQSHSLVEIVNLTFTVLTVMNLLIPAEMSTDGFSAEIGLEVMDVNMKQSMKQT